MAMDGVVAYALSKGFTKQFIGIGVSNITTTVVNGITEITFTFDDGSTYNLQLGALLTKAERDDIVYLLSRLTFSLDAGKKDLLFDNVPINNIVIDSKSNFYAIGDEHKLYIDITDNKIWRWDTSTSDYVPLSSDSVGIEIVETYKDLPVVTTDTICYCKSSYTDTTSSTTYEKGFYIWNSSTNVWELISTNNSGEKYEQFELYKDYHVGDQFKNDGTIYQVFKDFNCTTTFDDIRSNVIILMESYYVLTKADYSYIEANGLLNENAIYIITDEDEVETEYRETVGTAKTEWNVQHNLGKQYPSHVYVYDDADCEIVLPEITYLTANLLTINFDMPVAGRVIVVK